LLFFIDVDGLKRINDSFGHPEGDFALFRTAAILGMTFRRSDILARLGGDEFAALAIEASDHCGSTIMARFREALETVSAQESRYRLSLSVGIVRFTPSNTSSIAEMMLQADQAMYRVKRNQRTWSSGDAFCTRPVSEAEHVLSHELRKDEPEMNIISETL
jgi:diguanylate cyclase (GGDEF)-like protein